MAQAALADPPQTDARNRASARASVRPALLWCGLGFILGALFWHFVGFWTFVAGVVLAGHEGGAPLASGRGGLARPPTHVRADPAPGITGACVKLVLDRSGGATRSTPCGQGDSPLAHAGLGRRQDHALAAARRAVFTPARSSRLAQGN